MPHAALSTLVARAARSAGSAPAPTDGAVLARFARTRDGTAFAELVRRLGPMVLGVCRRVARDPHRADDAFQAAFLVLARRAADVRPPGAVRAWVYGVAVRTAREARTVDARRYAREVPVAAVPDRPAEPADAPDPDALRVLDEEVAALPEHLRAAVVLCELEGASRRDAAARLGVPEGTVSSRLAKARKLLADRLTRRGLSLPATLLAVLTHAAVPPRLAARTAALGTVPVPPTVSALANGVLKTMFVLKLKAGFALAAIALGALACAGIVAAPPAPPTAAAPPKSPAAAPAAAPAPFIPRPEITAPLAYEDLMLVLVTKDGAAAVVFSDATESTVAYKYRYESADGKTKKTGDGKLYERRTDKGDFDEAGLHIVAGPISVGWSRSNETRGWIYYIPEAVAVHMANAFNFDERVLNFGDQKVNSEKLDLQRFIRK